MSDQQQYVINLYLGGPHIDSVLNGELEYLQAKMFLNMLAERTYKPEYLPRPIPEPSQDWYELTVDQYVAYGRFLQRLRGKPLKPE
jgi:hypothetical protein